MICCIAFAIIRRDYLYFPCWCKVSLYTITLNQNIVNITVYKQFSLILFVFSIIISINILIMDIYLDLVWFRNRMILHFIETKIYICKKKTRWSIKNSKIFNHLKSNLSPSLIYSSSFYFYTASNSILT